MAMAHRKKFIKFQTEDIAILSATDTLVSDDLIHFICAMTMYVGIVGL